MTRPLLVLRGLHNGSPQVYRLLAGTSPVAIGGPLPGATFEPTESYQHFALNRVVQFRNTIYATIDRKIYRYNTLTETWVVVETFSETPVHVIAMNMGLYVMLDGSGEQFLVCFEATSSSGDWRIRTSYDGINWTNTQVAIDTFRSRKGKSFVYRNRLFVDCENVFAILDPVALSYDAIGTFGTGFSTRTDMCIFQNNLYLTTWFFNNAFLRLYRYEAGVWAFVQDIPTGGAASVNTGESSSIFTDGTSLFILGLSNDASAQRAWDLFQ